MGKIHVVKRADAVIRWVERLKKSYASGDTNNAYIEAECARADIEALRDDVIASISHSPKISATRCIIPAMRVIALSLAVVMSWALPVREVAPRMANEAVAFNAPGMADDVAPKTANEAVAVNAPGMANDIAPKTANKPVAPETVRQNQRKSLKTAPQKTSTYTQPEKPTPSQPAPKPAKTPAYDRLAHLTLTGQKALKGHNTTIITERGTNL